MCLEDVGGPHLSTQAIRTVVGDVNCFLHGIECNHRQHWAEDLFLVDLHRVVYALENRRLNISANRFLKDAFAAGHQIGAIGMVGFDIGQHVVHLLGIYQRADVGRRIKRIAWFPGF
ncbi:hypothetical protein D3C84_1050390 [compost metagenome]